MTPPDGRQRERLRQLAARGALEYHIDAIAEASARYPAAHRDPFHTCQHPDCVLVREDAAHVSTPPKNEILEAARQQIEAHPERLSYDVHAEVEALKANAYKREQKLDGDIPRRPYAVLRAALAPEQVLLAAWLAYDTARRKSQCIPVWDDRPLADELADAVQQYLDTLHTEGEL
jgi:hypothetical protein